MTHIWSLESEKPHLRWYLSNCPRFVQCSPATVLLFELKLCSTSHYHCLCFGSACIYPFNVFRAQMADWNTIFGETVNLHFAPEMQIFCFSANCPGALTGAPECFGKVPWSLLGPSWTSYNSHMAENRKPTIFQFFWPGRVQHENYMSAFFFQSEVSTRNDAQNQVRLSLKLCARCLVSLWEPYMITWKRKTEPQVPSK